MSLGLEPRALLALADELAAGADGSEGKAAAAVLAAHAALEAFVNETGAREIGSFNLRARFLPKWHDLCQRLLRRQLDAAPDLERLHAIRDAIVGYQGQPERLDRRAETPAPRTPQHVNAEIARWAVAAARNVIAEFDRLRTAQP
jgi:hypothetical protein